MKLTRCLGYILLIISSLSFVPGSVASEEKALVVGLQDTTTSLDPAKVSELVTRAVLHHLYETLVSFEGDDFSQPLPGLAESWEVSEDGKTWTFHIRQGVSFTSGNPVNADAVVFSLQRVLNISGQAVWLLTQFGITADSISKLDDNTVHIVLAEQYAPSLFLACLANISMSILDPAVVMEHEQDGDMGSTWLDTHSAGTGRFFLEERIQGETFTLKANEHYWQGKPLVNEVLVKNIPEPFEQAISLEEEEIDVAWNIGLGEVRRLEETPDIQIYETPTLRIRFAGMNLGYEPLSKSGVRNAIRYAIDYDGIIEFILQGAGSKIQSFIPKGVPGYNASTPYSPDIPKAKQLLADAGYPDGFDVELACENYSPWIDMGLQIKRDLGKIGINVTLKQMPNLGELIGYLFSKSYQMYITEWELDYMDPDANSKSFAHCNSADDDGKIKLVAWLSQYETPEIATLVELATREVDVQKREAMYQQITDTILDDGPYAFLHTPFIRYAIHFDQRELIDIPSPYLTGFPRIQ